MVEILSNLVGKIKKSKLYGDEVSEDASEEENSLRM